MAIGWSADTRRRRAHGYAGTRFSNSGAEEDWELSGNAYSGDYGGGITTSWSWPLIVRNRFINNEFYFTG